MKNSTQKIGKNLIKIAIKKGVKNQRGLEILKRRLAKKFKIPCPTNIELFKVYQKLSKEQKLKKLRTFEKILKKKPIRSLSGVVNVSVLTKPYFCPGKCIFCPCEKNMPKSYLSGEPAAERAKSLNYHPFLQVKKRIDVLRMSGHPTDKIELRIIGGSWSVYPRRYKYWFIKECFRAANEKKKPSKKIQKNLSRLKKDLLKEQKENERAKNRIVGISVETRPDFISQTEIKLLREFGVTMVEMGVQSIFDDILLKNKTNLTAKKIEKATQLLKDAGFKILYHITPNLLGSTLEKDLEVFKIIFSDEKFKPDWIKIYPIVVVKNSKLYKVFQKNYYRSYKDKDLIELLIKIKTILPKWVRVARIIRDIPAQKIVSGCKISNLREVVKKEMKKRGLDCPCIRCREIKGNYRQKEKIYLFRENYKASGGKEIFLSFENRKRTKILSYLRLRIPAPLHKETCCFSVLREAAIIREIKTLGELVEISKKSLSPQHRGLGKKLIKKAEKIAKREFSLKKIVVISGVGARNYFRKLGYKLQETYMTKVL